MTLEERLRLLLKSGDLDLPLPGSGSTPERHRRLAEFARQDVSLARLAEAHTDAVAILAEAGRAPESGKLYGVWASESPQHTLSLSRDEILRGSKAFCSGGSLLDRALVTVGTPQPLLIDVDLRKKADRIVIDSGGWAVIAFSETSTATVYFNEAPIERDCILGPSGWYLSRPGFWNGSCGPASCWAGGAEGLWDYCVAHPRENPQDVANLGGIYAMVSATKAALEQAGREIDVDPDNAMGAQKRALALRYFLDQACTEILKRFAHIYGPRALALDPSVAKRYQEIELYIRQSHAERDLESLGHLAQSIPAESFVQNGVAGNSP